MKNIVSAYWNLASDVFQTDLFIAPSHPSKMSRLLTQQSGWKAARQHTETL